MFTLNKLLDLGPAGKKLLLGSSRKTRIVSGSALLLALCAFGAAGVAPMAPEVDNIQVKAITQELPLPHLSEQIAALDASSPQNYIHEERVRSGDTLGTLLERLGVENPQVAAFIKSDATARNVLQLKAGKQLQAQTTSDGELNWLSSTVYDNNSNQLKNIVITRDGDHYKASETPLAMEKRIEMRSGEIRSSLFAATDAAQIPDSVASQIVDMFSTDIDFGADLRRGDHFNVVYETYWQNGQFIRAGRVLAGEFQNGATTYQAVWFQEPDGTQGGYYGFDGRSLKKAFLKSPLKFTRISSGFAMRKHPISGQWKQHKGVDFAAPTGTPIHASGDGTISFIGQQRGYGNVIMIKHWANYSTVYGHMSRFASNIHKGTKVSQGDVIGYVGMTGWATGPHLHYEFRIDNVAHNPMTVDIPHARPLATAQMQRFKSVTADMMHRFALLSPQTNNIRLAAK